ncbi:diguanylate cyclase domain-containing protein [Roseobacter sp. EG26]|uniref:GGDEF domain-containing protein n=1 Tax=Roseobacter sp. EG26 TaxID=3412477 RepID=UPI003CE58709
MQQISWRYIFWMHGLLGVFATASVLGMLFWMTGRIDQTERERTQDVLNLSIEEHTKKLVLSVEDYAYWTLAYEVVQADDAAEIYENIGSGATESELFDQLFILNESGQLRHAYDESLGARAHSMFDAAAYRGLVSQLRMNAAEDYQSVSGVVEIDQQFYLAAAAWITPDDVAEVPRAPYPMMIGITKLDQNWLSTLAKRARVNSLSFEHETGDAGNDTPFLADAMGQPLVALNWVAEHTGTKLRREMMPSLILFCLGLLGICGSATRYFHNQHKSLERAKQIATTDQLTGLLNRAGLEALLQRRDVAAMLENGQLATVYIDLNKFKELNDTHGHSAGDIALKVTAERLVEAAGPSDYVARLGGDEFLCVVLDRNPEERSIAVADRFSALGRKPISFADHDHVVEASVGVSVANPGTQWETLLSQSDAAMYWSKKKNAKEPVLFCKSMDGAGSLA